MIEPWRRELTEKRIRRRAFTSVRDLIVAIDEYIVNHSQNARVCVWTASADEYRTWYE
jgi:hypothetical protein